MKKMNFNGFRQILCKKIFFIVCIILLFFILGIIYTFNFVKPLYKSTCSVVLGKITPANLVFSENSQLQNSNVISQSDLKLNSELIDTYIALLSNKSLLEEVGKELKINFNKNQNVEIINVNRNDNSYLLEITVIDKNPQMAKDILKSVINRFSKSIEEIYGINNVYILNEANIENEPFNIHHIRDLFVFLLM